MSKTTQQSRLAIGIDVGGTGIKGCVVDLELGQLAFKRIRIPTPRPAHPDDVVTVIGQVVEQVLSTAVETGVADAGELETAPLGLTFPGIMKRNVAYSAANLGDDWIGVDIGKAVKQKTGHTAFVINDADAAGVAEMHFGAGTKRNSKKPSNKPRKGVVIMTTLGTGIGVAIFLDGKLLPNAELGHLEIHGHDAETRAAESAKVREDLSWAAWAERLQSYYSHLEFLLSPDLFIVGGGISKSHQEFLPLLDLKTEIVPAGLFNGAGIVGAAVLAAKASERKASKNKAKK
ncbi:ROK family protein [Saxibacter everestensis]|uniref:ROK family protein n=1 Tax=Saxibacter everestensis TaxID=2909229 RepID=A0ABY8QWW4_9MICO|nr:ROK family protein [Brevibacteriaceae bacterium ZFBP1038]